VAKRQVGDLAHYSNPLSPTMYFKRMSTLPNPVTSTVELGRQDVAGPQAKLLRSVHETFARELSDSLSTFLQSDIAVSLGEIGFLNAADYRDSLASPACLITLKLFPRQERMILHFEPPTVLGLLELLLGGAGTAPPVASRALTEIEWSLLEELVRVLVRALGEAWRSMVAVEFEVESLGSDPASLPCPAPSATMLRIEFALQWGEQTGTFELAVPRALFEPAESPADGQEARAGVKGDFTQNADLERNIAALEDAKVELEVRLHGPTLAFTEILDLKPGQVITFDYSLQKSLHGMVNGDLAILGHIVSAGQKRAFRVEQVP